MKLLVYRVGIKQQLPAHLNKLLSPIPLAHLFSLNSSLLLLLLLKLLHFLSCRVSELKAVASGSSLLEVTKQRIAKTLLMCRGSELS